MKINELPTAHAESELCSSSIFAMRVYTWIQPRECFFNIVAFPQPLIRDIANSPTSSSPGLSINVCQEIDPTFFVFMPTMTQDESEVEQASPVTRVDKGKQHEPIEEGDRCTQEYITTPELTDGQSPCSVPCRMPSPLLGIK